MLDIPKKKLEFLSQIDNYYHVAQSTIDSFKIDEYDRENIFRIIKLTLHKTNHMSSDLMSRKLESGFDDADFVSLIKYPLPAVYNVKTKRVIINLKFFGKKEVTNIDPRALYSVIFYGYILKLFYHRPLPLKTNREVCEYFLEMFMALFGKRYGIMASYKEMIPKLHFIIVSYLLTSYYGSKQDKTYTMAARSGALVKQFDVDFDDYDLYNSRQFIKLLSDSQVFPGFDLSTFAGYIFRRYNIIGLPMFEDEMRFMATLGASSMPTGGVFPPYLEKHHREIYQRLIKIIAAFI